MARKHQIRPRAIIGGKSQTRILINGRWLTLERALVVARGKVAEDSYEARLEALARFKELV